MSMMNETTAKCNRSKGGWFQSMRIVII